MGQSELIPGMAKLSEVVGFLEKELGAERVPDYPGAYNGLQLQNGVRFGGWLARWMLVNRSSKRRWQKESTFWWFIMGCFGRESGC